jgi:hypothetical protein
MNVHSLSVLSAFLFVYGVDDFVRWNVFSRRRFASQTPESRGMSIYYDNDNCNRHQEVYTDAAKKFKILVCASTSCAKKRKKLGMDEYETFANIYSLVKESNVRVASVEECPCLGSCSYAPCVAIEHDDFEGPVALEGMTESEFDARA